jgi:hypothetical protein
LCGRAQTAEQIERKMYFCVQKRLINIEAVAANLPNVREKDRESAYRISIRCYPFLDSISYVDFPRIAIEGSSVSVYVRKELRHLCAAELRQVDMDALYEDYLNELFKLIEALEKK